MTWDCRGMAAVAGMFGGAGVAAGLWLYRARIAPLLRQPITAHPDDAAAVRTQWMTDKRAERSKP